MSTLARAQAKTQASKGDSSTPVSGLVQRKCACGNAAGLTGSCPACESERRFGTNPIQAKLKISEPGDRYEQEADRVADEVMRMSEPTYLGNAKAFGRPPSANIQRKCDKFEDEVQRQREEEEDEEPAEGEKNLQRDSLDEDEKGALQAKKLPRQGSLVTPRMRARISILRGRGNPLSESERAFFEARFGADFGAVRIHDSQPAAETAQALNARAFTFGQEIVFGNGQYEPGTQAGRRLLAHELTHTLQQERLGAGGLSEQVMTKPETTSVPGDGSALEEPAEGNQPLATVACNDTQSKIVDTAVHDARKLAVDAANDARTLLALGAKAPQHLVVNFGCRFGPLTLKNLTVVSRGFGEILTHLNQAALGFDCDTSRPFRTFRCKTDARNRKTPAHARKKSDSPITLCRSFFDSEAEAVFNDADTKRAFVLIQQVANKVLPLPALRPPRAGAFRSSRMRANLAPLLARNSAESFGMFALFHDRELDPEDCKLTSKQRWKEERERQRSQRDPNAVAQNVEQCTEEDVNSQGKHKMCCDDERWSRGEKVALIESALQLARKIMPVVTSRLRNDEFFGCWFGTDDGEIFEEVRSKFQRAAGRIAAFPILWECDPGLTGLCAEDYSAYASVDSDAISLCTPKWFTKGDPARAVVIIHEVFHNVGVTFGARGRGEKNPEVYDENKIVEMAIGDRLKNAETYAGLTWAIYSVRSCPSAEKPDLKADVSCKQDPNNTGAKHSPEEKIQLALNGARQSIGAVLGLFDVGVPLEKIKDLKLRKALQDNFDPANTGGLTVDVLQEIHTKLKRMEEWSRLGPMRFKCDYKDEHPTCKPNLKTGKPTLAHADDAPSITLCSESFKGNYAHECNMFATDVILHEVAHFHHDVFDFAYKGGSGNYSQLTPNEHKRNADSYAQLVVEVSPIACSFMKAKPQPWKFELKRTQL